MLKATTKTNDLRRHLERVKDIPEKVLKETYLYFVKVTPVKTGNARRRTQLNGNEIEANYPYASELDAGRSKQAPKGMVAPAEEYFAKAMSREVAKNKD